MENNKSPLTVICDEMNDYINRHGQIPRSSFIQVWHDLTNEFWADLFDEVITVDSTTDYRLTSSVRDDIERLVIHLHNYRHVHANVLNPSLKDSVPKAVKHCEQWTTKTVLWRTMMELREYYCRINGIDLPNEDSSIGKLDRYKPKSVFEDMFSQA